MKHIFTFIFLGFLLMPNLFSQNTEFEVIVTSEQMQEFLGLGISMHSAKTYFLPSNATAKQKLYSETFSGFNTFSFWSYIENPSTRDQIISLAKQYGLKRIIVNPTMRDPLNYSYTPMDHANQQLIDIIEYLNAGYPIYGLTVMNKLNTNESNTIRVDPSWPVEFLKLFKAKLDSAGISNIKLGGPSTIEWEPYIDPSLHGAAHGYDFQPGDNMMYLNAILNDPEALQNLDAIELQSYGWSHTEQVRQIAKEHSKEQWVGLSATDGEDNDNGDPVLSPVSAANLLGNINHGVSIWNYWVWDQLANFNTGELNRRGKVLQHIGKSFKEGAIIRKCISDPYVFSNQMFWNYYDVDNPINSKQPELVTAAAKNTDDSFVIGMVNLTGVHAQHFYSRFYIDEATKLNVNISVEEFQPNEIAVFQIQKSDPNGNFSLLGDTYLFKNKLQVSVNSQDLIILKTDEVTVSDDVFLEEHKPDQLSAFQNDNKNVELIWQDNSLNEIEFVIERRLKGAVDFVTVSNVPANTTTYIDAEALSLNSIYEYRITAVSQVVIGTHTLNDSITSNLAEVKIDETTGTKLSILNSDISIYPNPSSGIIRISSQTFNEECVVQIYNMEGRMIWNRVSMMNEDLDISELPNGVYSVLIGNDKGFVIRKIILIND